MLQLSIPTIRDLQDAPERAVLSTLGACATNAEQVLLSRHPDALEFRAIIRRDSNGHTPPLLIATWQLINAIYKLSDAISLYDAALRASLCDDPDDSIPF